MNINKRSPENKETNLHHFCSGDFIGNFDANFFHISKSDAPFWHAQNTCNIRKSFFVQIFNSQRTHPYKYAYYQYCYGIAHSI